MIAPNPATHPILARHFGALGPPNEERRPREAASRGLPGSSYNRGIYSMNTEAATPRTGNVASLNDRWFASVCEQFPQIAERVFARGAANEVVVSNAWGLGVPNGTYQVSLRHDDIAFAIDSTLNPIRRLGQLIYILSFDTHADAQRFGNQLAVHLGYPLLDWTDATPHEHRGGAA